MLNRDEYLAAWSRWHGGAGTDSRLVRGWLTLAYTLARPLAGLPPVVATAWGWPWPPPPSGRPPPAGPG